LNGRFAVLILLVLLALGGLFFFLRPDPRATEPRTRTFDLSVEGGAMSPEEISVSEGDRVKLRITSESPLELHLHGYDIEREVEPDEPAELSFEARLTGRFEIEAEETHEELGILMVRPR
jgi:Cupredoxin-like domain